MLLLQERLRDLAPHPQAENEMKNLVSHWKSVCRDFEEEGPSCIRYACHPISFQKGVSYTNRSTRCEK